MACNSIFASGFFVLLLLGTTALLLYLAYVIRDSQRFYKDAMMHIVNGEKF